jgi:hypothetical protein
VQGDDRDELHVGGQPRPSLGGSPGPHRRRLVRQEAVAGLMRGWLLVLTLVLLLANAIVWFVVAVGG